MFCVDTQDSTDSGSARSNYIGYFCVFEPWSIVGITYSTSTATRSSTNALEEPSARWNSHLSRLACFLSDSTAASSFNYLNDTTSPHRLPGATMFSIGQGMVTFFFTLYRFCCVMESAWLFFTKLWRQVFFRLCKNFMTGLDGSAE